MNRYAKETGKRLPRFDMPSRRIDSLEYLAKCRSQSWTALHQNQYLPLRRSVMKPVASRLRQCEMKAWATRCATASAQLSETVRAAA